MALFGNKKEANEMPPPPGVPPDLNAPDMGAPPTDNSYYNKQPPQQPPADPYAGFQEPQPSYSEPAGSPDSERFEEIVKVWRAIANGLLPDGYPALRKLREIQWSINEDLETKGLDVLKVVEKRAEKVPELLEEAARTEVPDFLKFITPVQELLKEVHAMETEALTELAGSI